MTKEENEQIDSSTVKDEQTVKLSLAKDKLEITDSLSKVTEDDLVEDEPQVRVPFLVGAIGIGMFMGALDETIVTIAVPTISNHFGVNQLRVQWVILAYLIVIIGVTAIAGDFGDRYSNKLVFQVGMIIFSLGSLLCVFSWSLEWLIIFRIIQAVGATGTLANGTAIVTRFTNEKNRGLALGLTTLVGALGVVIGPPLGGIMIQFISWQSIFLINLPIGVIAFIFVQLAIPKTPPVGETSQKIDLLGSILFAGFLVSLIFGLSLFVDYVIPNPRIWSGVCFGVSILLLGLFLLWERRTSGPFIDLSLFRNRKFAVGTTSAIFLYLALNAIVFQLPFFLQDILLYDPSMVGLTFVGVPIGLSISAPLGGKLSSKIDARYISTIGLLAITAVLASLAIFVSVNLQMWLIILVAFIMGLAIGFFSAPNGNSVMSSVPEEELGIASGLLSLARNVGYSLGTASSVTIFAFLINFFQKANGGELKDPANYIPAVKIMFAIFASITLLASVISFFRGREIRDIAIPENGEITVDEPSEKDLELTFDEARELEPVK